MNAVPDPGAQHVGTFWLVNMMEQFPTMVAPRVSVTFSEIGVEGAQELALAMGQNDSSEVERRFAAGKRCYIGRHDGELAVYGWVTFDKEQIGELGLSILLKPGEAYVWNCETLTAYRGKQLYPALLTFILGELHARGLHRVWIGADSDNVASQKGMVLAGFRPIADFLLAQMPARRFWLVGCPGAAEQQIQDARYLLFSA